MMVSAVVAGVVSALLGMPGSSTPGPAADDAPPPGSVSVDIVTVAGSGCAVGTPFPYGAPDYSTIGIEWLGLPDPVITSQPAGARRICQASLLLSVPAGYSFGVVADSHRWHVELDAEEALMLRTQHYFPGEVSGPPSTHALVGPHNDTWEPGASFDAPAMSPCGQPVRLNLNNTTLAVGGTVDLYQINSAYSLTWATC